MRNQCPYSVEAPMKKVWFVHVCARVAELALEILPAAQIMCYSLITACGVWPVWCGLCGVSSIVEVSSM